MFAVLRRLTGIAALLLLAISSRAQDNASLLSGGAGAMGNIPARLTEGSAGTTEAFVSDVFFGRGVRGPYLLSWNQVATGSETVLVDGLRLSRDTDYALEYATGAVTFAQPVKSSSICRVRYSYDAASAKQNQASLSIPVTFDLLSSQASQYKLSLNYRQKDVRGGSPGSLVAMLGGKSRLSGNTEVSSSFLATPKAAGDDTTGNRTAFRIGTNTQGGNYQFITSFAQAGDAFGAAKDNGLEAGKQVMNMALAYRPSESVAFQSSVNRSADVEGEGKGQSALVATQNVVMTFKKAPKVAVTHQTVDSDAPGGAGRRQISDRLQLDHNFGQSASATLIGENVAVSEGGRTTGTTSTGLNVASRLAPTIGLQGSYRHSKSQAGSEDNGDITVDMAPARNVQVQSRFARKTGPSFSQTTTGLQVSAETKPGVKVEGNYLRDDATQAVAETRKLGVSVSTDPRWNLSAALGQQQNPGAIFWTREARAQAKPVSLFDVGGGYKVRDFRGGGRSIESFQTAVGLVPDRRWRIAARLDRNPEDGKGNIAFARSQGLDLQSDWGSWQMSGGLSRSYEDASDRLTRIVQAGLGIRLFGPGKLYTEYKWSRMRDQSMWDSYSYSLGYAYQLGDLSLSLSGSLSRQELDGTPMVDKTEKKAEARLGVRF
ncbi:MAG: hypothetical protein IT210_21915 [Armatimonadetes bacterium]|nr:hypothetical protein [Armatimonadota bacterium]